MSHVQLLRQSLLSAFTTGEPYVSKFLFDFVLNREAICELTNL